MSSDSERQLDIRQRHRTTAFTMALISLFTLIVSAFLYRAFSGFGTEPGKIDAKGNPIKALSVPQTPRPSLDSLQNLSVSWKTTHQSLLNLEQTQNTVLRQILEKLPSTGQKSMQALSSSSAPPLQAPPISWDIVYLRMQQLTYQHQNNIQKLLALQPVTDQ